MSAYTIEIQVVTASAGGSTNDVGVVVPSQQEDLHDGDTVTFKNATYKNPQGVRVWFPTNWHTGTDELVHLPEIENEATFTVDTTQMTDGSHPVLYQVFCDGILELAVGDSPPKMIIEKP